MLLMIISTFSRDFFCFSFLNYRHHNNEFNTASASKRVIQSTDVFASSNMEDYTAGNSDLDTTCMIGNKSENGGK